MLSEKFNSTKTDDLLLKEVTLPHRPTLDMLKDSAKFLTDESSVTFQFTWPSAKKTGEFTLRMSAPGVNKPFVWHLFNKKNGVREEVWKHATYDILLINNLLCSVCGESKDEVQLERVLLTSSSRFITVPGPEGKTVIEKDFRTLLKKAEARPSKPGSSNKTATKELIESVEKSLQDSESGLFTYPAFLFFLQQEFYRSNRTRSVFSILLVKCQLADKLNPHAEGVALNQEQMTELQKGVAKIMRRSDLLAHYKDMNLAIILPATKTAGAQTWAGKLGKFLVTLPLSGMTDTQSVSVSIGLASIDECSNLTALLAAAENSLIPPLKLS